MASPEQLRLPDDYQEVPTVNAGQVASDGWDKDADRGVSPEVLADIGYEDPEVVGGNMVLRLPDAPADSSKPYTGDALEDTGRPLYHEDYVPLTDEQKKTGAAGVYQAKQALEKHINKK